MTNKTTTGAAELPEALRTIQRFEVVDCIDSKHVPAVIPNKAGPWVRYEDHAAQVEALSAAQAGVPSDQLPSCVIQMQEMWDTLEKNGKATSNDLIRWSNALSEIERALAAAPQPSPSPAPAEAVERIVHLRADREKRVYVAGPMTGLPEFNFPLFNATAARLRSEGWHVENPAEHGHVEGAGWADYLRWDISRIATCGAVYLLPGWSKSKGATLEVHIAQVLGLRVLLADGAEHPRASPAPAQPGQEGEREVDLSDDLAELSMLNQLIDLGSKAAGFHATSNSDDGAKGTAAYVQWQETRAQMGEMIRAHYADRAARAAPQPATADAVSDEVYCGLQAAADVLGWIAKRQRQVGDVIEPVNDIRVASSLAAEGYRRIGIAMTAIDAALAAQRGGA